MFFRGFWLWHMMGDTSKKLDLGWNPRIPCLQYVDDTLMLLPPNLFSIKWDKILIYIFEPLSGLSINFHKSSLYQLGPASLSQISNLLHCRMRSFPFTTLGYHWNLLPLLKLNGSPLLIELIRGSLLRRGALYLVGVDLFLSTLYLPVSPFITCSFSCHNGL